MQIGGKRILITGASSGIGLALSREFVRSGATVILASRDQRALDEVSRKLHYLFPQFPTPLAITCDVSDPASVREMAASCVRICGGIDILVNNAGVSVYGDSMRTPIEAFRSVMDVNYFGALNCVLEVLPGMKAQGSGAIVNVASVAALHGVPYLGAYSASKAALAALGQSLRAELSGTGIMILNAYPNYTRTALFLHESHVGGALRPRHVYGRASCVARHIVWAVKHDRRELVLSTQGRALFVLRRLLPSLVERQLARLAESLRTVEE
jgi:short-subunit dehydrogenase